jgi:hypothetical protein
VETNPYAPPRQDQPPEPGPANEDGFIEGGRGVDVGRGYAWITEAWAIVGPSVGIWVLVTLLYAVMAIVLVIIPVVGRFALSFIAPFFSAGLLLGCRDVRAGRPFTVGHLFAGFQSAGGLVVIGLVHAGWALVLYGVGAALGFEAAVKAHAGGPPSAAMLQPLLSQTALFIVLGIPITMATYYAPALVALQGLSPLDAMKNSFLGATKNVLPYIVYSMVLTFFALLGALPCGLGLLVLFPVMFAAIYTSYRDVFFAERPF